MGTLGCLYHICIYKLVPQWSAGRLQSIASSELGPCVIIPLVAPLDAHEEVVHGVYGQLLVSAPKIHLAHPHAWVHGRYHARVASGSGKCELKAGAVPSIRRGKVIYAMAGGHGEVSDNPYFIGVFFWGGS